MNSVTLFDASGRSIQTFNVSGKQLQISLEGIESGIYFLSVNGERSSLKKIVIQ
ncbi:MAG: T9SS type A sorting domain-containing protein [Bacteroidota bacterium]